MQLSMSVALPQLRLVYLHSLLGVELSPSSFNESGGAPQMSSTVGGDDVSFTVTAAAGAAVALSRALTSGASSGSSYCHLTPTMAKKPYTILSP